MRPIDADALKEEFTCNCDEWICNIIDSEPTIEPKTKVIAQVAFDEDKLREIVYEAVERIKEEYDIVDGWIPCSERLPANDNWVIVSVFDECGDIPYRYSDFGWYLEVAKCWIVDSEQRTDVVAWMPLPAPCSM